MFNPRPWYKIPRNILLAIIMIIILGDLSIVGMIFNAEFMKSTIVHVIGFSIVYILIAYSVWIVALKREEGYRSVLIMLAILIALLEYTLPMLNDYLKVRYFANDVVTLTEKIIKGENIPPELLKSKDGEPLSIFVSKLAKENKDFVDQVDTFMNSMELCFPNRLATDGLLSNPEGINKSLKRILDAQNELENIKKATKKYVQNMKTNIELYIPKNIVPHAMESLTNAGGEAGVVKRVNAFLVFREEELKIITQIVYYLKTVAGMYRISDDGQVIFQRQKDLNVFNNFISVYNAVEKQILEKQQATMRDANVAIDRLRSGQ